jgi:hypothetical protein
MKARWRMDWEQLLPVAALVGFVVLWLFVLPRLGVRT